MALLSIRAAVRRARGVAAVVAVLLLCLPVAQPAAAELPKEQKLKAAFVYNFTKFIEWPGASFADERSSIVIGTFCDEALDLELQRVVGERSVGGRAIRVRRLDGVEAAAAVHLVYVCTEQTERFGRLRDVLAGRPVVTVGDSESAARLGATIVLVVVDDRIRFDVDTTAAERSGVKISAQLLKLARTVRNR